jgi:hypothetical protein
MEVFVRDVPPQLTENGLRNFLLPHLVGLSITTFHCQKQLHQRWALITFLRIEDGSRFLGTYGQGSPKQIEMLQSYISCSISKKAANAHLIRSLAKEEKEKENTPKLAKGLTKEKSNTSTVTTFPLSEISCGIWTYSGSELAFVPNLTWKTKAEAKFRTQSMSLTAEMGKRIDIPYSIVAGITTEDVGNVSFTFTLFKAPRIYVVSQQSNSVRDPSAAMSRLSLRDRGSSQRIRAGSIDNEHALLSGTCLVYRLAVSTRVTVGRGASNFAEEVGTHMRALAKMPGMPPIAHQRTNIHVPKKKYFIDQNQLRDTLTKMASHNPPVPWSLNFQLRRLEMNGYLPPAKIFTMLPEIERMLYRSGVFHTTNAVRKLFHQIPYPGPDTDASELELETLLNLLRENEAQSKRGGEEEVRLGANSGLAMIHRAMITPAGVYVEGPDPEPLNRVLREYAGYHEFFLRVEFADEDGQPVRYNPRVNNETIFHARFKNILDTGISIGGRQYNFLGFSHSSLRSQSCWFMTPFMHNGTLLLDRMIISKLGDFSQIRCPAKCAARIGQAFSETPVAITLATGVIKIMPDVERNDRVFSDGCGTISESMIRKLWGALPEGRKGDPTCFQIRFQGKPLPSHVYYHSSPLP